MDCNGGSGCIEFTIQAIFILNDIMLGLRWTCCDVAQPPRYAPPPIQSKG